MEDITTVENDALNAIALLSGAPMYAGTTLCSDVGSITHAWFDETRRMRAELVRLAEDVAYWAEERGHDPRRATL